MRSDGDIDTGTGYPPSRPAGYPNDDAIGGARPVAPPRGPDPISLGDGTDGPGGRPAGPSSAYPGDHGPGGLDRQVGRQHSPPPPPSIPPPGGENPRGTQSAWPARPPDPLRDGRVGADGSWDVRASTGRPAGVPPNGASPNGAPPNGAFPNGAPPNGAFPGGTVPPGHGGGAGAPRPGWSTATGGGRGGHAPDVGWDPRASDGRPYNAGPPTGVPRGLLPDDLAPREARVHSAGPHPGDPYAAGPQVGRPTAAGPQNAPPFPAGPIGGSQPPGTRPDGQPYDGARPPSNGGPPSNGAQANTGAGTATGWSRATGGYPGGAESGWPTSQRRPTEPPASFARPGPAPAADPAPAPAPGPGGYDGYARLAGDSGTQRSTEAEWQRDPWVTTTATPPGQDRGTALPASFDDDPSGGFTVDGVSPAPAWPGTPAAAPAAPMAGGPQDRWQATYPSYTRPIPIAQIPGAGSPGSGSSGLDVHSERAAGSSAAPPAQADAASWVVEAPANHHRPVERDTTGVRRLRPNQRTVLPGVETRTFDPLVDQIPPTPDSAVAPPPQLPPVPLGPSVLLPPPMSARGPAPQPRQPGPGDRGYAPLHDQSPSFQPSTSYPAPPPRTSQIPIAPSPAAIPTGPMPYLDAPDGTPPDRLPPGQPADPGRPRPGVDATGSHQARDRAPHQPPGQPPIQPGQGRHQTPARGPGDQRGAVRPQYGNGYPAGPAPVHPSPGPHHQQPAPDDGYGGAGHETGHRARGYDAGPPYPAPAPTPLPPQRWAYDERTNGDRDAAAAAQRAGLSPAALLPDPTEKASRGWRKVVWQATGGAVNPGLSPDEVRHRRLLAHIRTPLHDCHRIAVMSLKGGVGKTTTTIGLGATLADLRDDRVVAIDANPDRGTLGSKVPRTSPYTVRELLDDSPRLNRYVDIRRYLSQSSSRLEVLASANDPEISDAFEDSDYRAVDDLLQRYYSILLTDCGTGILHSAMHGVLSLADTLVIVTSSNADGGSSASATLDWLEAHGYADQVRESVSVISMFPQQGEAVDVDALEAHFAARTRRVVRVPWDPHLASGGQISLPDLRRDTRRAYREIAAAVAERFSPMDPADPFLG